MTYELFNYEMIQPSIDDMERLNRLYENGASTVLEKLDLAEYIIAGELEAGPDNGMEDDVIEALNKVWDLLGSIHTMIGVRKPFYHPTS